MKVLVISVTLFISLLLAACDTSGSSIGNSPIEFDGSFLNQQIRLVPLQELNSFKTSDSVGLQLLYDTENQIVFPSNYNLRLFIKQDGEWVEIQERPTQRYPGGEVTLTPDNPLSYGQIVTFFPKLEDPNKRYEMRIYVFGDMTTSDGVKEVGAYTDITLRP